MKTISSNNSEKCKLAESALREVIDPEIGLNIIDLGLIYQIQFEEEEKKIRCEMTLTTQFCPMGEHMTLAAQEAIQSVFPEYRAGVELCFDPVWTQERISEEGRIFLNR